MAEYTIDKIEYSGNVYKLQDNISGYLTSSSTLNATKLNGTIPSGCYTNTTYTFANGTNGFTVTPSGGTAQTVTVTPSITNNVTGSGTSGYLAKFNGANTITNGPALGSATTTYLRNDGSWATPTDTNTTYTLSGALSSHKFTSTLTAGGSGSGTSVSELTLVAGTGISITDDITNKEMTIALSSTIPSITLNGSSTTSPSFYAPTTAGTSGQVLQSNGSGAPTWTNSSGHILYGTTTPTAADGEDGDIYCIYS